MVDTLNNLRFEFLSGRQNTIVNPPIMHMTLNWCFTRVLIDTIGFNRCFIISSFNLATLQQFFKKRQNRRYYHFKHRLKNPLPRPQAFVGPTLTLCWQANIVGPTLILTSAWRHFTHWSNVHVETRNDSLKPLYPPPPRIPIVERHYKTLFFICEHFRVLTL